MLKKKDKEKTKSHFTDKKYPTKLIFMDVKESRKFFNLCGILNFHVIFSFQTIMYYSQKLNRAVWNPLPNTNVHKERIIIEILKLWQINNDKLLHTVVRWIHKNIIGNKTSRVMLTSKEKWLKILSNVFHWKISRFSSFLFEYFKTIDSSSMV